METAELLKVLLSWVVTLNSCSAPDQLPAVGYKSGSCFHAYTCGGRPSSILAWYDNNGTIYTDNRLQQHSDVMTRSILIHYLRVLNGRFNNTSYKKRVKREREAYAI